MVVPVDREGKVEDSTLLRREPTASTSLEPVSTRKAGGRQLNQQTQTVSKSVWCMTHIVNSFIITNAVYMTSEMKSTECYAWIVYIIVRMCRF